MILPERITRRWKEYVKDQLGIKSDFYALKHGNTTEMVDWTGEEDAAELNSHKSTAMVIGIYDTKQSSRQHERIRRVKNPF